jgi:hypothetical protein
MAEVLHQSTQQDKAANLTQAAMLFLSRQLQTHTAGEEGATIPSSSCHQLMQQALLQLQHGASTGKGAATEASVKEASRAVRQLLQVSTYRVAVHYQPALLHAVVTT